MEVEILKAGNTLIEIIILKLMRMVISLKEGGLGFKRKQQFYRILFTKFRLSWFLYLFLVFTFSTFSVATMAFSLEKSEEELYSKLFQNKQLEKDLKLS
jgi:hypothetical protein